VPQLAGLPAMLPPGVRADLGYQELIGFEKKLGTNEVSHTVDARWVEVPVSIFAQYGSDGVAGNRTVVLAISDRNAQPIARIPSGASQPAATSWLYTWSIQVTAFSSAVGHYVVMPLPIIAMEAGYVVDVGADLADAGDVLSNTFILVWRFPTGPQLPEPAALAPLAAPLLV